MKKILILYYSRTGNTKKMAELVAEGVTAEGDVTSVVESVEDFSVDLLPQYDGIIVGSPTYYGSMDHMTKKLFDDSVKFHGKLAGKVGGAFSSAANIGGGNETTITGILFAMLVHGMIVQGTPAGDHYGVVSIGAPDERVENQCKALGSRVAHLVKNVTD